VSETAVPIARWIGVHICPKVVGAWTWRGRFGVAWCIIETLLSPPAWRYMLMRPPMPRPAECYRLVIEINGRTYLRWRHGLLRKPVLFKALRGARHGQA
jgi:hypothetical protein